MVETGSHREVGTQDGETSAGTQPPRGRARGPQFFGPYELLSRMRLGGMAEVWKACRLGEPSRAVALKRLLPSYTDEAEYVGMFADEARLALRLRHPNIAQAFEVDYVDDQPFIVLEHIEGQDLAALIRRCRERSEAVPVAIACRVAVEVCKALEYAHALRDESGRPLAIVHRDVSPANVLLGYDGSVKLIDFGLAKSAEQLTRTNAGFLKGKHGYFSPEQASAQHVDPRSDLFSLGICLWEMLSAERLFLGATDFSTVTRVRSAPIPQLKPKNPKVPAALEAVLQRALTRDREQRMPSAHELRTALEPFARAATQELMQTYLRETFADELALDARGMDRDAPVEVGTGLLDAFDNLTPVSTVTGLLVMPVEPEVAAPVAEALEEVELSELEAHASELDEEPAPDEEPELHAASEAAAEPDAETDRPVATQTVEVEEPTRVVAYRSTLDGQVDAPSLDEALSARDSGEPRSDEPDTQITAAAHGEAHDAAEAADDDAARAIPRTLPGLGSVEWDDDELSTHLYDEPAAQKIAALAAGEPSAPGALSSVGGTPSRTNLAPFQSRASLPRGPVAASTSSTADATAPIATQTAATSTSTSTQPRPWIGLAVAAVLALGLFAGVFALLGKPRPGTIQLTTSPPDARVTFDGRPVVGTTSPFVLADVEPAVSHRIEVERDGYRTWSTQLTLGSGQTVQLPEVALIVSEPAPEPAAALPTNAPAPVVQPASPAGPQAPVVQAQPPAPKPSLLKPSAPSRPRPSPNTVTSPRPRAPASSAPAAATGGGTGTLRINSRPWSQVHVDGRLVGNTPQMSLSLSAGRHTISLVNPELKMRKTITVQVAAGSVTTKIVDLE